ncbi:exosome complex component RRP4 homolog isoform X2 [Brachypodium distachyon]|uniref:exosome complex component RRP4 homolog isoform X2 n=1 Tax=Brachypodium distachyon TaxID=15368 RepID=UPI000D0E24D9|nr:exosome complex component RRP4 homolog isoform X2 [Brachypodium distachyon]|eukprot:XP_024312184.1 exosome complex component RRP4 homolog isoform X2 [Brachypodium distachyon]
MGLTLSGALLSRRRPHPAAELLFASRCEAHRPTSSQPDYVLYKVAELLFSPTLPPPLFFPGHERPPLPAEPDPEGPPRGCAPRTADPRPRRRICRLRHCRGQHPRQPRGQYSQRAWCGGSRWGGGGDTVRRRGAGQQACLCADAPARYKPEVGDIIVGRVIEIAPKRWRLEINFTQDAVLMLSSMNLPDGIQRRRTAVDELNMRSIFEENDVVCLQRGQLLTVPAYLVKRRKQHFHHLEQYDVDLILGCNGFIWVGQHVLVRENTELKEDQHKLSDEVDTFTSIETRKHICRLANAVRVLSALGFILTIELIIQTAEASLSSNVEINAMLGAEFYVQTAEREARRRADLVRKKNGAR